MTEGLSPETCRAERLRLGLSSERLARLAGLAEPTVARFENRLVQPRPSTLVALRRAFRTAAGAV